jgi:hypothetical protein
LSLADLWRNHRDLGGGEFEGESVLFVDCVVRPTIRTVELHDEGCGTFDAHLVDTVLVTVERKNAAIGYGTD